MKSWSGLSKEGGPNQPLGLGSEIRDFCSLFDCGPAPTGGSLLGIWEDIARHQRIIVMGYVFLLVVKTDINGVFSPRTCYKTWGLWGPLIYMVTRTGQLGSPAWIHVTTAASYSDTCLRKGTTNRQRCYRDCRKYLEILVEYCFGGHQQHRVW